MSVSKWAYDPDLCDGKFCPGDCDICYEKLVGWMKFSDEEVTGQLPSIRKEQDNEQGDKSNL